ncbi:MAG TPA: hypothetical protein ENN17_01225 [bacterium]|nr:hypothetical protein [bacterium]
MARWNRVRSSLEWSTFFGVCTWLLASGITNTMTGANVWLLVLSRTLMGLLLGLWKRGIAWWARGLIVGFGVNLPAGLVVNRWTDFGGGLGFGFMMATGLVSGVLTEAAVRHREKEMAAARENS